VHHNIESAILRVKKLPLLTYRRELNAKQWGLPPIHRQIEDYVVRLSAIHTQNKERLRREDPTFLKPAAGL